MLVQIPVDKLNWKECKELISGSPPPQFRSFHTATSFGEAVSRTFASLTVLRSSLLVEKMLQMKFFSLTPVGV